jgi:2-keto-3-deoxygluconate permease
MAMIDKLCLSIERNDELTVPIKRTLEKVPGGMMIIPLLIGALIKTFAPQVITIGSFSTALMQGTLTILAVYYVCIGSTISLASTPYVLKKGGALLVAKIGMAMLLVFLISRFSPNNTFLGISTLAILAAMNDTNGGLYMALLGQYGRNKDVASYAIQSIESGPFLTMLVLGVTGLAHFPILAFVAAIAPLLLGVLLGNLDPSLRDWLGKASPIMIPFFAFALGISINLSSIGKAGLSGIALGVGVVVFTGIALIIMDRLTGGDGVTGLAAASTAGNAVAVPAAIAVLAHQYIPIVPQATVQVATAIIVTALLVPLVTSGWARLVNGKKVKSKDEQFTQQQQLNVQPQSEQAAS